ncbi:fibronectin type III domain-containing protein [Kineococcus sp. NPDC059986]|uniref:fibronectin type III domain-containing protein n=1 Tax=Kineococcus sp. NPDC059986 TaxID=3155538 RepID=UPI0034506344
MSPFRRPRRQAAVVGTLALALVLAPLPATWGIGPQSAAAATASNQSAPTGVQADATSSGVYVQWTAKTDGPSGYQVQYDTSVIGLGVGSTIKDVAGGSTTSTFISGSFLNSFAVRVRAVYGTGVLKTYSDWSGTVTASPNLNGTTPARPAGLVATPGQDSVVLTWNPPPGDSRTAVKVYRDGAQVATVAVPATTWTDTTGVLGTQYTYYLVAVGTQPTYVSTASDSVVAGPYDRIPPAAPAGLTAVAGDTTATLSWTTGSEPDLDHYEVTRAGVVTVVPRTAPTRTFTVLPNGSPLTWAVTAVDRWGNVSAASSVSATPRDTTPPDVPTGLQVGAGDASLSVTWNASTAADTAGYRVYVDGVARPVTTSRAVQLTGLVNGRSYAVSVSAVDAVGNESAASAVVSATPRDTTPPDVPTGLQVGAGDASLSVTWNASTAADTAGYRVYVDGVARPVTTSRAVQLTGLVNGRSYAVSVSAVDAVGNESAASAVVSATPRDTTPPAAPTGLAAVAGDGQVALSWTANTEPDLASYRVVDAGGTVLATVTAPGRTAVVTGLANGTATSFRLLAVDTAGNVSAASAPVSATPRDLTPPGAPTGLTAVPGDGAAAFSWTANPEADLARYDVLDTAGNVVASVAAPATAAMVAGLPNDAAQTFRLVAVDRAGNVSAASTPVTVTPRDTTPPSAPSTVTAVAGDASATVTWTSSGSPDVVRYEVLDQSGTVRATAPTGATSATVTGLVNGTTYTFSVVAVDAAGNRSPAGSATPVTPAAPQLPAPAGVSVAAQDASGTVTWNPVPGAATYQVLLDGTVSATVTSTSAALTGLVNGRTYAVTVRAVAGSGQSGSLSAPVALTPRAPSAPAAPPVSGSGSTGISTTRDGRFSLIGTAAPLEASDTNTQLELYLRDADTGTVSRLDPTAAGSDLGTSQSALSADGRYVVVVTSLAKVPADTNKLPDVYRLDRQTSTWELVSVPTSGKVATVAGTELQGQPRVYSQGPAVAVSADGRFVFFFSGRTDLVPDDTNKVLDLFRKDMTTGAVTRVSTTSTGAQIGAGATGPALAVTPDGRFVLFPSSVQNMAVLWRKDLATGALDVVSGRGDAGNLSAAYPVSNDARDVSISDDGRFVAFSSSSSALTSSAAEFLVYRRDMAAAGQFTRVGIQTTTSRWEHGAQLDPSGRYVFFATTAKVGADTDNRTDWYRTDAQNPTAPAVMVTSQADGTPTARRLTSQETTAEFGVLHVLTVDSVLVTTMQSLVPADANGVVDTYAKNLTTGSVASRM